MLHIPIHLSQGGAQIGHVKWYTQFPVARLFSQKIVLTTTCSFVKPITSTA